MFSNSFQGKSVIVTGAGRGIGRAITKKLDSLGAVVYALSKSPANLATLKSECERVETIPVDLTDWSKTRAVVEKIGCVDHLINNAAIVLPGQFLAITSSDLDSMFNLNLKAVVNVSQVVAKRMIQEGRGGSIVNISSAASLKSLTYVTAYGTLKAGLDQLTKMMAVELAPHKIRVNSVNPGGVRDENERDPEEVQRFLERVSMDKIEDHMGRIPMKNCLVEMEEVVNAVLFCLANPMPHLTGILLPLDGGFSAT